MVRNLRFIAVFIIILFIGWFAFMVLHKPPEKYTVNLSSQTVIKQITSLNRLETASYTIEKIIDVGTNGNKFTQLLYGDRILLVAHGQVIAGFDMSKLDANDVTVDGSTLRVTLPAPEILVSKLDSEQTRVYDRRQGLLTKGDNNLEAEARSEAERVIKDAACKGGILNEATKNARNQLSGLFKSLGFETVVIDVPQGSC
jgi:hypothetical protein